tara:strand:- start:131 stop:289 length:159 start_codon:yes stop_codon:yes gene_type:complete
MSEEDNRTEDKKLIKEWLAKGNKITICPPGQKSDPDKIKNVWVRRQGRPKAK